MITNARSTQLLRDFFLCRGNKSVRCESRSRRSIGVPTAFLELMMAIPRYLGG